MAGPGFVLGAMEVVELDTGAEWECSSLQDLTQPWVFVNHFKHHQQRRLLSQPPASGAGAIGRFFHALTAQTMPLQAVERIIWCRRDAFSQVHANVF